MKAMTVEERFERIEHINAGLAEDRRKDREEYKMLWRDTQRHIDELTQKIAATNDTITRLAEESSAEDARLKKRIEELDARLGNRIEELGGRIDGLVSAIGAFLRDRNGGKQ
jgi:chromosome segregation ATPase